MELDNFKNTWDDIGSKLKIKQNFNPQKLDKMNKTKFQSSLNKILLPEIFGAVLCIGFAIYIGYNFSKLETLTFQIAGIVAIVLFVILPVISLLGILQVYKVADINKPYSETLKNFAVGKIKFCKLQKLNFTLCYLLAVTVILISTRLFGRNDITDSKYFFIVAYSFVYIVLLFFSKWVAKTYNKTIQQAEELLKDF